MIPNVFIRQGWLAYLELGASSLRGWCHLLLPLGLLLDMLIVPELLVGLEGEPFVVAIGHCFKECAALRQTLGVQQQRAHATGDKYACRCRKVIVQSLLQK